jgi:hypothetical protein
VTILTVLSELKNIKNRLRSRILVLMLSIIVFISQVLLVIYIPNIKVFFIAFSMGMLFVTTLILLMEMIIEFMDYKVYKGFLVVLEKED